MKSLIALIALLSVTSLQAFECKQNEAQFMGKVKDYWISYDDHGVKDCSVEIEYTDYKVSQVCPLDESEAKIVLDLDCKLNLKSGQEVSGYLIGNNGVVVID